MDEDVLLGTLFAGRFHIETLLGSGGMGSVYLARHEVLQRLFALKVIRTDMLSDQNVAARFRREARAASRIEHPNIIQIVDFGQDEDGRLYLAMEYVEGPTLADVVRREGPFPVQRALLLLEQIVDALRAAHASNVIHRDLKPANILLTTSAAGKPDHVKILDFGLAKILDSFTTAGLSTHGQMFGTPEYMSPERCMDAPADHRSDIYSLGIIGFELITGRVPFSGKVVETLSAHLGEAPHAPSAASGRSDIPAELDRMVLRCLAKEPEDRLQSADDLLVIIRSLQPPEQPRQKQPLETLPADHHITEERAGSTPAHDRVLAPRPRGGSEPAAQSSRLEALERLAYALRDRGLGLPQMTCQLAQLLEARDQQLQVRSVLQMLHQQIEELRMTARIRESRLGQILHQLTHELHQTDPAAAALGRDLRARIDAVTKRIQKIAGDLAGQEQEIHVRREHQLRSLAHLADEVGRRVKTLRVSLAPLVSRLDLSSDHELQRLVADTRLVS